MTKKPSRILNPSEEKLPRGGGRVESAVGPISWHIRTLDKEGPWGWKQINALTLWGDVFSKLSNFETMQWSEILNRNNHAIPISRICPNAQNRLREINQDDTDEIVSLHLTGKKRIWGIRDRHILKVLWWDPDHTICPSLKKHT